MKEKIKDLQNFARISQECDQDFLMHPAEARSFLVEVERLLERLDSLEKDAARYRWRKENSQVRIGRFQDKYRAETQNSVLTDWFDSHDEAIDAAMQSQGATK